MTEPLADTWNNRDLLVLRTVVRLYDETMADVPVGDVEAATRLDPDDVQRAGSALATAALVDTMGAWGHPVLRFTSVSADARRLAGSWPSPERAADRLREGLQHIEKHGTPAEADVAAKALEVFEAPGVNLITRLASGVLGEDFT